MTKITCSIRINPTLKTDLDNLTAFNGQSLGHMVENEMGDLLYELVDEFESDMRSTIRTLRGIPVLEQWLIEKAGGLDKLLADDKSNPKYEISEDEWYGLDPKKDIKKFKARLAVQSDVEPAIYYWVLEVLKSEQIKALREIQEFLDLADQFETIVPSWCGVWLDENGCITDPARIDIERKRYDNEPLQDRLDKIGRRYGIPNYMEMWNGAQPATCRFLRRIAIEMR